VSSVDVHLNLMNGLHELRTVVLIVDKNDN